MSVVFFWGRIPGVWEMRISSSISSMRRGMDGKRDLGDLRITGLFGLEKTPGDDPARVTWSR